VFRSPSDTEKRLGLWVDRIGRGQGDSIWPYFRILGLYSAVGVLHGDGVYESPVWGSVPVCEGDVILVSPDVPHRYHPHRVWETCWILWDGPEARMLAQMGCFQAEGLVVPGQAATVVKTVQQLSDIMDDGTVGSILARKTALLNLMLDLHEAHRRQAPPSTDQEVESLAAWINRHPERHPHIAELAARCSLSESHFRRRFQALTGSSPVEFITAAKIAAAKERLVSGITIKAAAAELGFRDEFYFMRTFKRVTGMTAGQFLHGARLPHASRKGLPRKQPSLASRVARP
jgi:AraC-like DNA-binding protein